MIRRPPRSTLDRSSAASDVYKRQRLFNRKLVVAPSRPAIGKVPLLDHLRAEETAKEVFGPVSYTHLRAHETVLDLVCRLLLEKKKHTTHSYEHTKPH